MLILGPDMRGLAIFLAVIIVAPTLVTAEPNWPGEPVDNHLYMSWAALTQEVNDWSIDNPDIVMLSSICLLYTSPSPRDGLLSRMPSSA